MSTADRLESLREFRDYVRKTDLQNDRAFESVLREARAVLELSDGEMADELRVSRPTVNRWMNGRNLPHNALRQPISTWIQRKLVAKMVRLETYAKRASASAYAHSPAMAR